MTEIEISEDEMRMWRNRLIRSERMNKRFAGKNGLWRRLSDIYEGKDVLDPIGIPQVRVNLMFATVRQIVATLYFKGPTMYARGLTPRGKAVGHLLCNSVLPFERMVMQADKEERQCIHNAVLYGTGIMKHGYNAEFAPYTPYADTPAQDLEDAPDDQQYEVTGSLTEHATTVRIGHPWVRSIDPWNFGCDPECNDFNDARWLWHCFRRSWRDCIEDSRYNKKAREELRPSGQSAWFSREDVDSERDNGLADDASMVTLYEIFDRVTGRIIVMSDTGKYPLMAYQYPGGKESTGPYRFLSLYKMNHCPWGLPLAMQFLPQCEAINLLRTQMMSHLQEWGWTKIFYNANRFEKDDIKRLKNASGHSYTPLITDSNPNEAVYELPQRSINADAWNLANQYQTDMDQVSGINENARGTTNGATATEASIVAAQGGVRTEDMMAQVVAFLRASTQCTIKMLRTFWGPERIVPMLTEDGQIAAQFPVSLDDANSEYEIDIEPGSTQRIDTGTRTRQVIDMMATLTPYVPYLQAQGFDVNWPELVKRMIKESGLFGQTENILVQLPPPQAQPQQGQPAGQPPGQQPKASPQDQFGNSYRDKPAFQSGRALSEAMTN